MARRTNSSPQTRAVLTELLSAARDWHYGYDVSKATGLKSGTLYPHPDAAGGAAAGWKRAGRRRRSPASHRDTSTG